MKSSVEGRDFLKLFRPSFDELMLLKDGGILICANTPENAALLRDFDRGAEMEKYVGQPMVFKALEKGHPARTIEASALAAEQVTF